MRVALLMFLAVAGCAVQESLLSATGPLRGDGLALAPPAGSGWLVASQAPGRLAFTRRTGVPGRAGSLVPYLLTAGADTITDPSLAASLQVDTPVAARAWLARRLAAPRRENLGLDVVPAELHGARCAAYEATQADRYDPEHVLPDHVDDRSQYAQHGLLCAHPRVAGRVVQVFYNEQFLRDGMPVRRVGEAEVRAFYDGVRWDAAR